ncbi:MAG TPA: ABC transporter substrate-binding protein [Roseiflexaceae bacterium]|nr:ABC transporter substrate-binding protein [Roseiflexaceae bacterium]
MNTRHRWLLALLAILSLLLAACGGAPPAAEQPTASASSGQAAPTNAPAPTAAPSAAPAAEPTAAPAPTTVAEPAQSGGGQKIRVWIVDWGETAGQFASLLTAGAKSLGLELELVQNVEYDKVLAAIQGGDPPELIVPGGADNIGTYAREGLVMPLDDLIAKGGVDMNDVVPGSLGVCRYYGKLYCLPWGTDAYALYWNKDLFQQAGLDPEKPPQTLDELAEYAKKLNKTDKDGNLTQIGFIPDFEWSHTGDTYAQLFGANFYNPDGTKITIATDPMLQAIEWQKQFYVGPGVEKVERLKSGFGDAAQNGFNSGKIAMMLNGEWIPAAIKESSPNLRYGVAPFPYPADHPERKGQVVLGGTVVAIPANVKDVDLAWKMFSWMEQPQNVADVMVNNGNLPTSKKAATDPRFREDPNLALFLDLASGPNAKGYIFTPINSELSDKFGKIEEQAIRGQISDVKDELQKAQDELQPMLDEAVKTQK